MTETVGYKGGDGSKEILDSIRRVGKLAIFPYTKHATYIRAHPHIYFSKTALACKNC